MVYSKKLRCLLILLCLSIVAIVGFIPCNVKAAVSPTYTNPNTGYYVVIEDEANLLSDEEKVKLSIDMTPITEYCSVIFYSTNDNPYGGTRTLAVEKTYEYFSNNGVSTSFIIDMDKRNIWIYSRGGIEKVITTSYANTVTDNVYTYASAANYYMCASEAYKQMYRVLNGQKIAMPMKYTSMALLSLILGFFISFVLVLISIRNRRASATEVIKNTNHKVVIENPKTILMNTTKKYSPQSSGGSGGGGGSFGGGGGGGGHGGGGGGGHGF